MITSLGLLMTTSLGLEGVIIENTVFRRAYTCMLYASFFSWEKTLKNTVSRRAFTCMLYANFFSWENTLKNTVSRRSFTCMLFVIFFFLDSLGSVIQCTKFDTMWKLVQSLFYVNIMSGPMHWSAKPNICPFSLTSNSLNGTQGCPKDD